MFLIMFKTVCFKHEYNVTLILDDIKNLSFEQSMVARRSHPNCH